MTNLVFTVSKIYHLEQLGYAVKVSGEPFKFKTIEAAVEFIQEYRADMEKLASLVAGKKTELAFKLNFMDVSLSELVAL